MAGVVDHSTVNSFQRSVRHRLLPSEQCILASTNVSVNGMRVFLFCIYFDFLPRYQQESISSEKRKSFVFGAQLPCRVALFCVPVMILLSR